MALVCDENDQPRHMLAQVDDITDEVADAARLAHSATHDPLTDVANRSALEERLEPMIAAANRRDEVLGCLFIDLDDFKSVNDDFGHDVGDALLCEVADRIRSCLRVEDFVARLGGDEFVVLASLTDGAAVDQLASRLVAVVGQSFEMDDLRVRVRCSIGVALHVDTDPDPCQRAREGGRPRDVPGEGRRAGHVDPLPPGRRVDARARRQPADRRRGAVPAAAGHHRRAPPRPRRRPDRRRVECMREAPRCLHGGGPGGPGRSRTSSRRRPRWCRPSGGRSRWRAAGPSPTRCGS